MNKKIDHSFDLLLRLNRVNNQDLFLRGFSHLLNNPIGSIHLASRLLNGYTQDIKTLFNELSDESEQIPVGFREDGLTALSDIPQVIQGISDSAQRLNQLVSYLIEFGDRGTIIAGSHDADLNRLVLLCTTMAAHKISEHTNCLSLDLSPGLPTLHLDEQQMLQVILNLLMNSLLSLKDRPSAVVISTLYDSAAACVKMSVRDEGTGIPQDIMGKIMEPFFSTWPEYGCIGLGLTVADRIISNHGGELNIESESGRGTTVIVSLPVHCKIASVTANPL